MLEKVLGRRAGAEAVHADEFAVRPITASQPNRTAASIAILTGALPMIALLRFAGCASSNSSEGTETTRDAMPRSASCFWAATAISTSEPEANSDTLASPWAATSS